MCQILAPTLVGPASGHFGKSAQSGSGQVKIFGHWVDFTTASACRLFTERWN